MELAKKHSIPIRHVSSERRMSHWLTSQRRCIMFIGSLELAWHNNLYRAFNMLASAAEKEVGVSI